jgi:hypothetical protein
VSNSHDKTPEDAIREAAAQLSPGSALNAARGFLHALNSGQLEESASYLAPDGEVRAEHLHSLDLRYLDEGGWSPLEHSIMSKDIECPLAVGDGPGDRDRRSENPCWVGCHGLRMCPFRALWRRQSASSVTKTASTCNVACRKSVEVAGIEPASSGAAIGLLRAQPAKNCRGRHNCRRQCRPVTNEGVLSVQLV